MRLFESVNELKNYLLEEKASGKQIGFVPTMGALHEGHISLVKQCLLENDLCVVSIFVNPTQFNDKNDLETYPRTLDKDCQLLKDIGCECVFVPSVEEMYPETDQRVFDLGAVTTVMEGAFRPGHFNGVAQIVSKLFYAVNPNKAYFGEKDFQQVAVICAMVDQLSLPVEIVTCPTFRESDGLAMSSRNVRLTPEQRKKAPLIAAALKESTTFAKQKDVNEVVDWVVNTISKVPFMQVEYFEIVDSKTLQPIQNWEESKEPIGCIAVFCGEVRLIDNIKYD